MGPYINTRNNTEIQTENSKMDIQFQKIGKVSGELTINMAKADYEANVNKSLKELGKRYKCPASVPVTFPQVLLRKCTVPKLRLTK